MIKWVFGADTQPFRRGLDEMRAQVKGFSSSIGGKLAGALSLAAGALSMTAVVSGIKKAIGSASGLGESLSKSLAVFGDNSKDVEVWSAGLAKSFGQSQGAALEAATSFGAVFRVLGVAEKPAAEMSKRLVELASDMASFNNTSVEDALTAIGSGLRGEAEPLRRFGVLLDDATLRQIALSKGIYDGRAPLTIQQKSMAAYEAIIRQTSLAQGDFQRTSSGAANSQRILTAQAENASAAMGTKLLPQYEQFLAILKSIDVGPIAEGMGTVISGIVKVARTAGSVLGTYIGLLYTDWNAFFGFLAKNFKAVGGMIAGVASKDTSAISRAWGEMSLDVTKELENMEARAKAARAQIASEWDDIWGEKPSSPTPTVDPVENERKQRAQELADILAEISRAEEDARQKELTLAQKILAVEKEIAAAKQKAASPDANEAAQGRLDGIKAEERLKILHEESDKENERAFKDAKDAFDKLESLRAKEKELDRSQEMEKLTPQQKIETLERDRDKAVERAKVLDSVDPFTGKKIDEGGAIEARIKAKELQMEIDAMIAGASSPSTPEIKAEDLRRAGGGGFANFGGAADPQKQAVDRLDRANRLLESIDRKLQPAAITPPADF
jgi:hypothetical protein